MNINLHIDRLVLDGLDNEGLDSNALAKAVQGELIRQLATSGISPALEQGGAYAAVWSNAIQLSDSTISADLGEQIGGAVYESLTDQRRN